MISLRKQDTGGPERQRVNKKKKINKKEPPLQIPRSVLHRLTIRGKVSELTG